KGEQRALLVGGEMQRADLGIELRIGTAAAIIMFDHVFEGHQASVVHVRRGAGDLAQGRSLESSAILGAAGDGEASLIGDDAVAEGDAGIVEALVAEI